MDINEVDLLLKYIFAAAGQEVSGHREVGPIHSPVPDRRSDQGREVHLGPE